MAQLGMVGLGRMGANMVRRLMRAGHECVVYDHTQEHVKQIAGEGAVGSESLADLASKLTPPRSVPSRPIIRRFGIVGSWSSNSCVNCGPSVQSPAVPSTSMARCAAAPWRA